MPVYVSTPFGDSIIVDQIYCSCMVTINGYDTLVDLFLLDMADLEVMSWIDHLRIMLS